MTGNDDDDEDEKQEQEEKVAMPVITIDSNLCGNPFIGIVSDDTE